MTKIRWNFSAGPSTLPQVALERAKNEFLDFNGTGCSLMELSHRSRDFEAVLNRASAAVLDLLGLESASTSSASPSSSSSAGYHVLWMQGGASMQFACVPLNLLWAPDRRIGYCVTGVWSRKAYEEAQRLFPGSGADSRPQVQLLMTEKQAAAGFQEPVRIGPESGCDVVYYCDNETVNGIEFQQIPEVPPGVDLVCDMSSNMLSRRVPNANRFSVIIAGAQKNIGPAGVTLVIIKDEVLKRRQAAYSSAPAGTTPILPLMLDFQTYVNSNSLYNTPPVYPIYICQLVLDWLLEQTLANVDEYNKQKASTLYATIDDSQGFYRCLVSPKQRSRMNVVFRIFGGSDQTAPNADLEAKFVKEATAAGLSGLAGHRSVGGLRASIYNAMPLEGVETLVDFMRQFQSANA